ncbi:DUF1223 domain-containing protein [uncultured Sphingomonas sp.]|jgi:hypothetical protein|uniref:DUF1223 domain-containing protein n=1 Tax=uncultured Sphingomonas sp. TaxID=158754 RepID=UPI0030DAC092
MTLAQPRYRAPLLAAAVVLTACSAAGTSTAPTRTADANPALVVELYQSQGCSSCPPAIANVNAIADRPDVLALTFAVTYWDRLGWKDTFGDPAFTDRQRRYAVVAGRQGVFTPQVIVNGRTSIVGGRRAELDAALEATPRLAGGPAIAANGSDVTVAARNRPARPATVWLVRYDPRTLRVAIGRGENGGRKIDHRNVVRQLTRLGSWNGSATSFRIGRAVSNGLAGAILVQDGVAGPIFAAHRI